jgi:hypothetical protein
MRFAIVNGHRVEATKGAKGLCPCCDSELVAKCGELRIHHWAHKGNRVCDPWWEPETEWHRAWKNNFSIDWQEVILTDEITGEKHIADVCTSDRLVIEFQHSPIMPKEQKSREEFYKNMVWVVDGSRLKFEYSRFLSAKENFIKTNRPRIFAVDSVEECFSHNWINSSVPVVVDFKNARRVQNKDDCRNNLYCLFPKRLGEYRLIAEISPIAFIKSIANGEWLQRVKNFTDSIIISEQNLEKRNELFIEQLIQRLPPRIREGARRYMKQKLLKH